MLFQAYDGDLPDVIAAALKIQGGEVRGLPESSDSSSTIHMMKTDGRWDGMMESLSADSLMVKTMMADLAEFCRRPRLQWTVIRRSSVATCHSCRGRGGDTEEEDGDDRVIRFSQDQRRMAIL